MSELLYVSSLTNLVAGKLFRIRKKFRILYLLLTQGYQKSSVGDPWHLCADPDLYLWLMDLVPDPVLTPGPFFSSLILRMPKKHFFKNFPYTLPTGTSSLVKNFFINFAGITVFQSAQHIYEKRERSGARSGSVPLTGNGSGFRMAQKHADFGSRSPTLLSKASSLAENFETTYRTCFFM